MKMKKSIIKVRAEKTRTKKILFPKIIFSAFFLLIIIKHANNRDESAVSFARY